MKTHNLKTIPIYFDRVWNLEKTFEVRKNDRDFQNGDIVILNEFDTETQTYSGRSLEAKITYILQDYAPIEKGYVVFALVVNNWIDLNELKDV